MLENLQWYSQVKLVGHIFNCCSRFSADVAKRKGQFIGCVNCVIIHFGFAHRVHKMKLLVILGYIFYGSLLWNFYGNTCNHLYTNCNSVVYRLHDLPRTANTRLFCNITNLPHVKHNLRHRQVEIRLIF